MTDKYGCRECHYRGTNDEVTDHVMSEHNPMRDLVVPVTQLQDE